ncbi:hypothetical protein NQZ68_031527 [Dissostichus eleginoides]|nr:hypothetical protein NQZ68_031527 [Dissostichus eleginoides]
MYNLFMAMLNVLSQDYPEQRVSRTSAYQTYQPIIAPGTDGEKGDDVTLSKWSWSQQPRETFTGNLIFAGGREEPLCTTMHHMNRFPEGLYSMFGQGHMPERDGDNESSAMILNGVLEGVGPHLRSICSTMIG